MTRRVLLALGFAVLAICPTAAADTHDAATCGRDDVHTAITAASTGDTVTIPPGTCEWTSGVTINKGVKLQGAGAGRLEGSSTSSVAIGTGSKSFTILSGSIVSGATGWTNGETVTARYKGDGYNQHMTGTVTSWDGTTLTLNITSTTGSGTYASWVFDVAATTTITNSYGNTGEPYYVLFTLTPDTSNSIEISGLRIDTATSYSDVIKVNYTSSGKPTLFHDLRLSRGTAYYTGRHFWLNANGSILWHIYGDTGLDGVAAGRSGSMNSFRITTQFDNSDRNGWNLPNTMGTADTNGTVNTYIEDSYFAGCGSITDWDDNARGVFRHNVLDNSVAASHGWDSSWYGGGTHVEYYNNLAIISSLGSAAYNLDAFFESRGGTGVFLDNVVPDNTSSRWGDKAELKWQIQNLTYTQGPFAQWGKAVSGLQWPAPHQIGQGHKTGTTSVTHETSNADIHATYNGLTGMSTIAGHSPQHYLGDYCPWYQANNTGAGNYTNVHGSNYQTPAADEDSAADYFFDGTSDSDAVSGVLPGWINATSGLLSARPGSANEGAAYYATDTSTIYVWRTDAWTTWYTKYTYPHPLRGEGGEPDPPPAGGATPGASGVRFNGAGR